MSGIPRAGADGNSLRRSVNVMREHVMALTSRPSSAFTAAEAQALIDAALTAQETLTDEDVEDIVEGAVSFDTGDLVFDGGSTLYVAFGTDNDWTADRGTGSARSTLTGSGTKPVSLSDFQNLAWPTPAP